MPEEDMAKATSVTCTGGASHSAAARDRENGSREAIGPLFDFLLFLTSLGGQEGFQGRVLRFGGVLSKFQLYRRHLDLFHGIFLCCLCALQPSTAM